MKSSSSLYFVIFVLVQLVPLIYVVFVAYEYYLPNGEAHIVLHDQQVAEILGLNLSGGILFNGFASNSVHTYLKCNLSLFYVYPEHSVDIYVLYYSMAMSTLAYALIILLGWRMHRFVRENLRGASNTSRRTLEVQRQLTRTLIIQVSAYSLHMNG
jgi:hypothetical protein